MKAIVKISIVMILSVLIWRFVGYLNERLEEEYSRSGHFWIAFVTTVLTLILIESARRISKLEWWHLGMANTLGNVRSFGLGFILWLVPAAIGLIVCLMAGWVEITPHTNLANLLVSVLILMATVFLIEALPEELIFRGYLYRTVQTLYPHWATVLAQVLLFTLFGFAVGAIYSIEQLMFLPGFAFILGYIRAVSGNVWTTIGFHTAIMTVTQILNPMHQHFQVSGMFTLQFFAFILLPSIIGATTLGFLYPHHNWNTKEKSVN